jgi:hypothetical protein
MQRAAGVSQALRRDRTRAHREQIQVLAVQNEVSKDSSGFRQTGPQNRVYAAHAATPSVITTGFGSGYNQFVIRPFAN